jgi:hypothetical protein
MPRSHYPPRILTTRDLAILKRLAELRGVPIEHIEEEFFDHDPYTLKKNTNPARACERRLRELARDGFIRLVREHDGRERRKLVVLDDRVNRIWAGERPIARRPSRRRPSVRAGVHHVRTLDALVSIRRDIACQGGTILSIKLDGDLRAAEQKGRRTAFGDSYEPVPDAVVIVKLQWRAN